MSFQLAHRSGEKNMKNHIFIGIDVSEDTLDVWIHPLNQYKLFANNKKGIN